MSLPLFIARRMSLRQPSERHQGESQGGGILVPVIGIALSVAVMLLSIAVLSGFGKEIRMKLAGFEAQLIVGVNGIMRDGTGTVEDDDNLITRADLAPAEAVLPEDAIVTLSIRQPAIIKTPHDFSGSVVKGVDTDYDWTFIRGALVEGEIPDYSADSTLYSVVISRTFARALDLNVSDRVDAYFLGSNGAYRARRLKISGIFDTHFSEYDRNMLFGSINMLRQLAAIPDSCATVAEITGLRSDAEIDDAWGAVVEAYRDRIYSGESDKLMSVANIHDSAAVFYSWLTLLDTNVTVILSLMGILSALTLVSSLFILILRRVNMIGILKAMGASDSQIRSAFILLSAKLLLLGLLVGNTLGLGLIFIQKATGFVPLDPEAYYLDRVPVEISWPMVVVLNLAIIILSLLVLILPSAIISTISPSKAIRYD